MSSIHVRMTLLLFLMPNIAQYSLTQVLMSTFMPTQMPRKLSWVYILQKKYFRQNIYPWILLYFNSSSKFIAMYRVVWCRNFPSKLEQNFEQKSLNNFHVTWNMKRYRRRLWSRERRKVKRCFFDFERNHW